MVGLDLWITFWPTVTDLTVCGSSAHHAINLTPGVGGYIVSPPKSDRIACRTENCERNVRLKKITESCFVGIARVHWFSILALITINQPTDQGLPTFLFYFIFWTCLPFWRLWPDSMGLADCHWGLTNSTLASLASWSTSISETRERVHDDENLFKVLKSNVKFT